MIHCPSLCFVVLVVGNGGSRGDTLPRPACRTPSKVSFLYLFLFPCHYFCSCLSLAFLLLSIALHSSSSAHTPLSSLFPSHNNYYYYYYFYYYYCCCCCCCCCCCFIRRTSNPSLRPSLIRRLKLIAHPTLSPSLPTPLPPFSGTERTGEGREEREGREGGRVG